MGRVKILIVEDSPTHQKIAQVNLKRYDAEIRVVGDGLQALAEAAREFYDLIVMDLMMPNMDGLTASRRIRELEASSGRHAVIVAVTAAGKLDECLQAGMDDLVMKPANYDQIMATWLPDCRKLT